MKNTSKLTRIFLLVVFFTAPVILKAQKAPFKWGKISSKDLQMKKYPLDPEADAAVLGAFGKMSFNLKKSKYLILFESIYRIKLFNQNAIDKYGNQRIKYYSYQASSSLSDVKAQVLRPNGEKVQIDKKEIVTEKLNEYWSELVIPFSNLEPGAVIEYSYTLKSNYTLNPVDWTFQGEIPVRHSELYLQIPEYYEYVIFNQGRPLDINEKTSFQENISVKDKSNDIFRSFAGASSSKATFSTIQIPINEYQLVMKDIPSLKEEPFITTMSDYYARIQLQLQRIQYPNSLPEVIMSDWSELSKKLLEANFFGGQLQSGKIKKLVEKDGGMIRSDFTTDVSYAMAVADYITNEIEWDNSYGIGSPQGVEHAFETKKGSGSEKNLLLIATLRNAEITAYPLLTSTRAHGKVQELYPFLSQFNHTLLYAELDGEATLIDLTKKDIPFGLVHLNALNKRGFIVDEKIPQWIDIIPAKSNSVYVLELEPTENGELAGHLQAKFKGYDAINERRNYTADKSKYFEAQFINSVGDLSIENIVPTGYDSTSLESALEFDFSDASINSNGDYLYIIPIIYEAINENPLKLIERNYPLEFPRPISNKHVVYVKIPEGYEVESIPGASIIKAINESFKFSFTTGTTGEKIQIISDFEINSTFIPQQDYDELKKFYNMVVSKMQEQIVFKKL